MSPRGTPAATVIVPVRNARAFVLEQLDALARQLGGRSDIECIVIDDASTDGTPEAIEAWIDRREDSEQFLLVRRSARGGPNASRNEGLRRARGEFLMFTDGDDIVAPGWIDAFLASRNVHGLLCGRLIEFRGVGPREPAGTPPGDWAPPRWAGWAYASGGCMAGPRCMFEAAEGFDENILIGGSETEFAIRVQLLRGVEVAPVPGAALWYRLPASSAGWFAKHFARERGHAYIRRRYPGQVRRHGVRIATLAIGRGLVTLVRGRSVTPDARAGAVHGIIRGAGDGLGSVWWGALYRLRMPPPKLLGNAGRAPAADVDRTT